MEGKVETLRKKSVLKKTAVLLLSGVLLGSGAYVPVFAEGANTAEAVSTEAKQGEYTDPDPAKNDPLYESGQNSREAGLVGAAGDSIEKNLVHDSRFSNGYSKHYGIDVSRYEKNIDWDAVKNSGKDFAIIRMGYRAGGNGRIYEDPYGTANLRGAIRAGLKVGVYIFSQALNEDEAREEADWLVNSVSSYQSGITIPYIMDYEYVGDSGRLKRAKLSKASASANVNAFVSEIKSHGNQAMLYANTNFLNEQLDVSAIDTDCDYWVARYRQKGADYDGPYTYWQYSDSGKVDGISTNCDLDVWYEATDSAGDDWSTVDNGTNTDKSSGSENADDTADDRSGSGDAAVKFTAMYRLYNPNSGEHFYTASADERDGLAKLGWRKEGTAWNNPETGIAVYRLYNPNTGDHHYTVHAGERDYLVKAGWNDEGIGWYAAEQGIPVYRLYNPNAKGAGSHHYTTSSNERDALVKAGWNDEGIGWHAL